MMLGMQLATPPGRNGAAMGRVGVLIAGLVLCVAVTACGSSNTVALKNTKPSGTRVSTETVHVGRLTEIFDTSLPSDAASRAVVLGFRSDMILWDKSDESLALMSPASSFVTGSALSKLKLGIAEASASDVIPSGTDRFFKTSVSSLSGASATVTTCDDGSKFEDVNQDTGVPDPSWSAPADQQYIFVTWQMARVGGRWLLSTVTVATLPSPLAKPCQPLARFEAAGVGYPPACDRGFAIPGSPRLSGDRPPARAETCALSSVGQASRPG
jgi:hypothetical protein